MNIGVDGAKNLFTLSKKDKSGQQQSETLESMILYYLNKMHQQINGHCKIIETNPDNQGIVWHCSLVLMIIAIVNKYWNVQSQNWYWS